ncbi:MAG: hypothetical protein K0U74_05805 [Alphaproteobacteria bacterium]|nr:hypothetical protein [Alphaproteobacteria bacterium]
MCDGTALEWLRFSSFSQVEGDAGSGSNKERRRYLEACMGSGLRPNAGGGQGDGWISEQA